MADKAYSFPGNHAWLILVKEDQKRRNRERAAGWPPGFDVGWHTKRAS